MIEFLRKAFGSKITDNSNASRKLQEIFEQFPKAGKPSLIHFEVILRGYKSEENINGFLSMISNSQAKSKIADIANKNSMDDLYGVIGRIVSGRLINTDPIGVKNG